jgi:DNA-binding LacI/PurR family transcriptional regulator
MAVSIKDIAQLAGVSHSTVSRALRKSPLISPETSERVRQIAEREGYTPSALARGLVTNRSEAIGVVVTSIADPFNGEVVAGIEEVANRHRYTVLLATSQADPEREVSVVRSFQARRVEGILVASSRVGGLHTPLLTKLRIPIVLLNNQHPSLFVHSVSCDNRSGAYLAARHLIDLGHREIAYLGDAHGLHSDSERFEGYEKAMREAGYPVEERLVVRADGKVAGARLAAQKLLAGNRPTAICCYNDMSALGVFAEAAARNLKIPEDLSITGFDDIFCAPYLSSPLTTVRQPMKELGRQAMEMMLALLRGEKTERALLIEGDLIVRGSTAKPREIYQPILSGKNSDTRSS